jgi:hypothetical protein
MLSDAAPWIHEAPDTGGVPFLDCTEPDELQARRPFAVPPVARIPPSASAWPLSLRRAACGRSAAMWKVLRDPSGGRHHATVCSQGRPHRQGGLARYLHRLSNRPSSPSSASTAGEFGEPVESELSATRRGHSPGRAIPMMGSIERAHRGTIFLDEVATLTPEARSSSCKNLQERCLRRVGP